VFVFHATRCAAAEGTLRPWLARIRVLCIALCWLTRRVLSLSANATVRRHSCTLRTISHAKRVRRRASSGGGRRIKIDNVGQEVILHALATTPD